MAIKYCASAFVVDEATNKILLMYNRKLSKWLQPGGHIEDNELPYEAAIREVFEETGIKIKIVNLDETDTFEPIAKVPYDTVIGPMLDMQFYAIPLNIDSVHNNEHNQIGWFSIQDLDEMNVEIDIKHQLQKRLSFK